jgi:ABC-2 type transport system ATP-binding protein
MEEEYAVVVKNLSKTFKKQIAVDNISFNIKKGEVFALLGPNGAGKTTTLRMITTLLKPTSGSIEILGHDPQKEPQLVRSQFGLTSQTSSVDQDLSARENLMIFARLNNLSVSAAKQRTNELLQEFDLVGSADKPLADFSGGMRRRLDLAVSLISRPAIIFLDEPTTGLDPRTRIQMWDVIKTLVAAGSTIVLTTQYLEEADRLADHIAMIDHGEIVGFGTPAELKETVGGAKLELRFNDATQAVQAVEKITPMLTGKIKVDDTSISIPLPNVTEVTTILNKLSEDQLEIIDIDVKQPSMDDVFFSMTVGKN